MQMMSPSALPPVQFGSADKSEFHPQNRIQAYLMPPGEMEQPLPSPQALSKGIFQHSKKAFGVGALLGAITGVLLSGSKSPTVSPDTAEDLLANTVKTSLLGGIFAFVGATVHGAMQTKALLQTQTMQPKRNPPPDFSLN